MRKVLQLIVSMILIYKITALAVPVVQDSNLTTITSDCVSNKQVLVGRDGRDGPAGPAGPAGRDGLPGPAGAPGADGHDGTNEQKGDKGEIGEPGRVGLPGKNGRDGTIGQKGNKGERGVPGIVGAPGSGAPGTNGRDGTIGRKGNKGERGVPGMVGPPGSGAPGTNGRDGTIGQKGDKGGKGEPGIVGPPGPVNGGATYTRWGRTSCPNTAGTSLVYSGRAAKSWYDQSGGGGNYQCLPNIPQYGQYAPGVQDLAPIYGVEYQLQDGSPLPAALHNHNVPCAVCHVSTRAAVLMIPAWRHCPNQWTLEYTGYLMTEYYTHGKATYECVDKDAESVPGSHANTNGGLFYNVEANCNGIPCPPYDPQKELTCAVCTK